MKRIYVLDLPVAYSRMAGLKKKKLLAGLSLPGVEAKSGGCTKKAPPESVVKCAENNEASNIGQRQWNNVRILLLDPANTAPILTRGENWDWAILSGKHWT